MPSTHRSIQELDERQKKAEAAENLSKLAVAGQKYFEALQNQPPSPFGVLPIQYPNVGIQVTQNAHTILSVTAQAPIISQLLQAIFQVVDQGPLHIEIWTLDFNKEK